MFFCCFKRGFGFRKVFFVVVFLEVFRVLDVFFTGSVFLVFFAAVLKKKNLWLGNLWVLRTLGDLCCTCLPGLKACFKNKKTCSRHFLFVFSDSEIHKLVN